ncbi:MAG TPA: hypothetical protein VJH03_23295 [Blastocatellia bacterium]|nr:hypothetical protein [Blastocatellia bacterium]
MSAVFIRAEISAEDLRLLLLAYGIEHPYRVIGFDEIAQAIRHAGKHAIRAGLARLAEEGLVTKFGGRYCFNKSIPLEVQGVIERSVTPSGTIRISTP